MKMGGTIAQLWDVAVLVLIVFATRWILNAHGAQFPRVEGNTHIYGIRWPMRVVGLAIAIIFLIIVIEFRHEWTHKSNLWLLAIPIAFALLGVWLANGSVVTDPDKITKRVFWSSRSFRWKEITEIRFYETRWLIVLYSGPRKLSVDTRFIAVRQLLAEAVNHTRIQPTIK
jgi:hypothetical protein